MSVYFSVICLLFFTFCGWASTKLVIFLLLKKISLQGAVVETSSNAPLHPLVHNFAEFLIQEGISIEAVEAQISNKTSLDKLKPEIELSIDQFLRHKLKEVFPMLASLMGEKTIGQLKEAFLAELEVLFPTVMRSYVQKLTGGSTSAQLIAAKLADGSGQRILEFTKKVLVKELTLLPIAGALAGLIIGLMFLGLLFVANWLPVVI